MEEKKIPLSGVDQVEDGFTEETAPDIQTVAWQATGVSRKEMKASLESVGVEVPDKPKAEGPTGVDSVQEGFTAEPEMNAVEDLSATRYAAAPQEVEAKIEKVETEYLGDRVKLGEAFLAGLQASGYTGDLDDLRRLVEEIKKQ